jgi:hypothetical protein
MVRNASLMALAYFVTITPAAAKVGDKAWASCVWQTSPKSADNWLSMKPATWQDPFEGSSSLLGLRLAALCGAMPAIELKPNRLPNFKQFAAMLKSTRPKAPLGKDSDSSAIELCAFSLSKDEKPFYFRYDVVRIDVGGRTITFQQYFADADGMQLRLPQDLRVLPKTDDAITTNCRRIANNGSLTDA